MSADINTDPNRVIIFDTTLRDGEQSPGCSMNLEEKLRVAKTLEGMGVDVIEAGFPIASPGDFEAVNAVAKVVKDSIVCGLARSGNMDIDSAAEALKPAERKRIHTFISTSPLHMEKKLQMTPEEVHQAVIDSVTRARGYVEDVEWSPEDGTRTDHDFLCKCVESAIKAGASTINIPDTVGYTMPNEFAELIRMVRERVPNSDKAVFSVHCHNDLGLAVANSLAAVDAGARQVECTINGIGERAGNASLAEVAVMVKDKLGFEISIDESRITMLSRMVENFSGKWIAANTPVVGADVFTQTAGIHADGDLKGNLYVSRLSPERFARKRIYALGKMSGKASIANNLEELGISLSPEDQAKVLERVVALGDSKHVITAEDLPFIIADIMESKEYQHIELHNCSINTGLDVDSTASVLVTIDGDEYQSSGAGNGGFDAFMDAIEKILNEKEFVMPLLADYEVHIPRGGKTDALTECIITWQTDDQEFKTRGVDSNQVLAAVKATLRMINVMLHAQAGQATV